MKKFFESTLGHILRWVFIIPISFISYAITFWLTTSMFRSGNRYYGDSFIMQLFIDGPFSFIDTFICVGFASSAFIVCGAMTAPRYKRIVSIILTTILIILILLSVILLTTLIDSFHFTSIVHWISMVIGAIAGNYYVWNEYTEYTE